MAQYIITLSKTLQTTVLVDFNDSWTKDMVQDWTDAHRNVLNDVSGDFPDWFEVDFSVEDITKNYDDDNADYRVGEN
jgi:hypothetical protein